MTDLKEKKEKKKRKKKKEQYELNKKQKQKSIANKFVKSLAKKGIYVKGFK